MSKSEYEVYFENGEATFREIALLRSELSQQSQRGDKREEDRQRIKRLINAIESLDANQTLFLKELKNNYDTEQEQ